MAQLAIDNSFAITDESIASLLDDEQNHYNASLLAYGHDLLQRLDGIANGPAILSLWRAFAWEKAGSPKHKFKLKSSMIMDAESALLATLRGAT